MSQTLNVFTWWFHNRTRALFARSHFPYLTFPAISAGFFTWMYVWAVIMLNKHIVITAVDTTQRWKEGKRNFVTQFPVDFSFSIFHLAAWWTSRFNLFLSRFSFRWNRRIDEHALPDVDDPINLLLSSINREKRIGKQFIDSSHAIRGLSCIEGNVDMIAFPFPENNLSACDSCTKGSSFMTQRKIRKLGLKFEVQLKLKQTTISNL